MVCDPRRAGAESPFRLLRSVSLHNSKIGYTSSLGFLAAFFLLFMDEHHAFWVLNALLSDALPDWPRGGSRHNGSNYCGACLRTSTAPLFSCYPYGLHNLYSDGVPKLLVHLEVLDTLLSSYIDKQLAAHFAEH